MNPEVLLVLKLSIGIDGERFAVRIGYISRSVGGSASRGEITRIDFSEWTGGGLGISSDSMEMVATKLEVDIIITL